MPGRRRGDGRDEVVGGGPVGGWLDRWSSRPRSIAAGLAPGTTTCRGRIGRMARRLRLLLVGLLAVVAAGDAGRGGGVGRCRPARARRRGRGRRCRAGGVGGSARRRRRRRPTSCRARSGARVPCSTPPTTPRCGWPGARARSRSTRPRSSATRRAAPIDRVELNTIAARLGGMSLDRRHRRRDGGRRDRQRPDDRRAARRRSCPSAGRVDGPRPLPGDAAEQPDRLELAVHAGQRRGRHLPLAAVGQPQARRSTGRTTATRSRRR